MNPPILTIAIPTYNRSESLITTVKALLPQLTGDCELLILDNHSIDPVEELLQEIFENNHKIHSIKLIRHRGNVGGMENVLRCIENASGRFVWLLGDDDTPRIDAVKAILSHILQFPEAIVFNFYLKCPQHEIRTKKSQTSGSVAYLSQTKSLGELVFISNIVLSVAHALPNLNEAHIWQSSHIPQLIVAAMMLRPNMNAVFSNDELVVRETLMSHASTHTSILPIAAGIGNILYPRWSPDEEKALKKLALWFSVFTVINQLITLAAIGSIEKKIAINYYKKIYQSLHLPPFSRGRRSFLLLSPLLINNIRYAIFFRKIAFRFLKSRSYSTFSAPDFNRQ